jgi:hypothetical protein
VRRKRRRKTDDFDAALSEIPTFVDCTVLALADRGTAEVVVQNDTSGVMVCGPALVHGVCDAHVCRGVKGRVAHDLKIGRVHRVGSIKRGGRIYARREKRERKTGVRVLQPIQSSNYGIPLTHSTTLQFSSAPTYTSILFFHPSHHLSVLCQPFQ